MVSLRAPAGCRYYSYDGALHSVPEDGVVDVDRHVAVVLKSHGFVDPHDVADPLFDSVKDQVAITRDEVVSMLSDLGVAVASSVTNMQTLVDALKAACKTKVPRDDDDSMTAEPKTELRAPPSPRKK